MPKITADQPDILTKLICAMTIKRTFITVTLAALIGGALGGVFGFAAGNLTPDFFRHFMLIRDVEPVGFATFAGSTAGILLGGGLGVFSVLVQLILEWRKK
jgi:hypothetical protein